MSLTRDVARTPLLQPTPTAGPCPRSLNLLDREPAAAQQVARIARWERDALILPGQYAMQERYRIATQLQLAKRGLRTQERGGGSSTRWVSRWAQRHYYYGYCVWLINLSHENTAMTGMGTINWCRRFKTRIETQPDKSKLAVQKMLHLALSWLLRWLAIHHPSNQSTSNAAATHPPTCAHALRTASAIACAM